MHTHNKDQIHVCGHIYIVYVYIYIYICIYIYIQALPFEECDRDRAPSFAFGRAIFRAPGRWNIFFLSRFIFRLNFMLHNTITVAVTL